MLFSRLGQSISQLYRSRNVLGGGGNCRRSQTLTSSSVYQSGYIRQADDCLGVLKHFLGSLTANNERNGSGLSSKVYISDLTSVLANSRIHRFFSSEAPEEKNYDDFYSKEKKETLKGNNQKFEFKGESSTYDDIADCMMVVYFGVLLCPMIIILYLIFVPREETQIYFHELNRLMKQGLVDHIVILNKSVAEVYVKNSTSTDGSITEFSSLAKKYINIRSVESFQKQLKEAQEALGMDYHDHVPVPVWYTFK